MQTQLEMALENVRVLWDDISFLEAQLNALEPDTAAYESKERVLNVKWRLWSDESRKVERLFDLEAKEAAQERWQWHETNDTLDLY